jgi:hypothetical protein
VVHASSILGTQMLHFYPHRPDLVRRLQQLGSAVGGEVRLPRLPWIYDSIRFLCEWPTARRTHLLYNELRSALFSKSEWTLLVLGGGSRHP